MYIFVHLRLKQQQRISASLSLYMALYNLGGAQYISILICNRLSYSHKAYAEPTRAYATAVP